MFFIAILLSTFAYALQGIFMVRYIRSMDHLSAGMYRTLSLSISMLPLLFLAGWENISQVLPFIPTLILAAVLGAVGQWTSFFAYQSLPVGTVQALGASSRVIGLIILGVLYFGDQVTGEQYFWMAGIIIATSLLAMAKNHMPHLDTKVISGIIWEVISGFLVALAFFFMGKVSKELDPFVSAYFWETFIGITSFLIAFTRQSFGGKKLEKISLKTFKRILLVCSPTMVGTGGFAYAVTIGPIGLASAIGTAGIPLTTLMAHYLYHEKLTRTQWFWIWMTVVTIAGLKLSL